MFINQILDGLKNLHKPHLKFLRVLFQTIFVCQSRINYSSLARHSQLSERTFRRQFRQAVDFIAMNEAIINRTECQITAFAMDASFIKKSGKETFGLDKFWNGSASRAEKGLEASIISLVCGRRQASFVLTVDQTEPHLSSKDDNLEKKTRIDFYAEQVEKAARRFLNTRASAYLMVITPSRTSGNIRAKCYAFEENSGCKTFETVTFRSFVDDYLFSTK